MREIHAARVRVSASAASASMHQQDRDALLVLAERDAHVVEGVEDIRQQAGDLQRHADPGDPRDRPDRAAQEPALGQDVPEHVDRELDREPRDHQQHENAQQGNGLVAREEELAQGHEPPGEHGECDPGEIAFAESPTLSGMDAAAKLARERPGDQHGGADRGQLP